MLGPFSMCGPLSPVTLQQNLIQATNVNHIYNFRFSSNHIFKTKKKQMKFI